jgi:transcriptional regulator of acetoin/glycerol metabolism
MPSPADERHLSSIRRSHERCSALGLNRREKPDPDPARRADLVLVRERNSRLFNHAAPVMELLYEQIVDTESMVVLTDTSGMILHSIGDQEFLERASRVALSPGVSWDEKSKGTNAIGTAIINETPTLVHAGEHFIHANHFLTCSAAPIFDPRGNILGVLDVTGDHRSYHGHTMGLVKMSARMVENHWLTEDFRNSLRLHFHSRPEFIDTLLEGIIAIGHDGRILGSNRSALDQLGMSGAALRMRSVTTLFGVTLGNLVDHFRAPVATPLRLEAADGRQFVGSARFNWPVWHATVPLAERFAERESGSAETPGEDDHALAPRGMPVRASMRTIVPPSACATRFSGLRYLQTGDVQMEEVIEKIRCVLDRGIALLICGETGTGKELLARAIHQDSTRFAAPFVVVNCASIPESLIEAELFGYEDSAFAGARRKGTHGKIAQAHGATLFLDEIGDMPLALQARLLRVLEQRQVVPLGTDKSIAVDFAVVSATHRDLREMIERGAFREDLYYRLNGLAVRLPALRDRTDLLAIVHRILRTEAPARSVELDPDVERLFARYRWPGNVRQLTNVLRSACAMAAGAPRVMCCHLPDDFVDDAESEGDGVPAGSPWQQIVSRAAMPGATESAPALTATTRTLDELEIEMIRQALAAANGNISVASKRLGISRNTIYRKLRWNQR